MLKKKHKRIVFQAPFDVVSEEMQRTINELLNAEYYVCLTNKEQRTIIDCQSTELLLDCIKHIGENDSKFKDDLTNIVIDLQTHNKQN